MNTRQKYFARLIIEHGWYSALRMTGYDRRYAYQLLKKPNFKEYQLSILKETFDKVGITLEDLVRKRLAIADDADNPANVRDKIYCDIIKVIEESQRELPQGGGQATTLPIFGPRGPQQTLRPSKEKNIIEVDFKEKTDDKQTEKNPAQKTGN